MPRVFDQYEIDIEMTKHRHSYINSGIILWRSQTINLEDKRENVWETEIFSASMHHHLRHREPPAFGSSWVWSVGRDLQCRFFNHQRETPPGVHNVILRILIPLQALSLCWTVLKDGHRWISRSWTRFCSFLSTWMFIGETWSFILPSRFMWQELKKLGLPKEDFRFSKLSEELVLNPADPVENVRSLANTKTIFSSA